MRKAHLFVAVAGFLSGCGAVSQQSGEQSLAAIQVTTPSLVARMLPFLHNDALMTQARALSFEQLYELLHEQASNATISLNGHLITAARTRIEGMHGDFAALDQTYPSLDALFTQANFHGPSVSSAQLTQSIDAATALLAPSPALALFNDPTCLTGLRQRQNVANAGILASASVPELNPDEMPTIDPVLEPGTYTADQVRTGQRQYAYRQESKAATEAVFAVSAASVPLATLTGGLSTCATLPAQGYFVGKSLVKIGNALRDERYIKNHAIPVPGIKEKTQ